MRAFANEPLKSYQIPEIIYNDQGVTMKGMFYPSDNPRLLFVKMLSEIEEEIKEIDRWKEWDSWTRVIEGSWIHRRVEFNREKVKIGFGCCIGGVGFGYEKAESGELISMPHLGNVIIEDGVIIHNNTCIDRAVLGSTEIGAGTVIDNLVHVAHGVKIGKNVLIVAGCVLGGSCEIGDNSFLGMNVSVKNKVKIGKGCTIGMGAVVIRDVEDGQTVIGNPAKPLIKEPCAG